jgi:hypothetical protein
MKSLQEIYENYKTPEGGGDKGTCHTYIPLYETLLAPYRSNTNTSLLEIGVYKGHSIRMWKEYFGGKVTGIDIKLQASFDDLIDDPQFRVIIADATQVSILDLLKDETFDIIIDDGSHQLKDQIISFNLLKSRVRSGGLYIIEDIDGIDNTADIFKNLHNNCTIIDNRHIKNRYDDVLAIYKF